MNQTYKPDGYTSVAPYLIVNGANDTIDFLKRVFDGVEGRHFTNPDGSVMHAEVRLDDTVVMLADSAPNWPAIPAHVHVYVPDVDATYQRALAAGATSVQEPTKKEDADRRAGVIDPSGTTWWIATQVDS